eukprot:g8819.t1
MDRGVASLASTSDYREDAAALEKQVQDALEEICQRNPYYEGMDAERALRRASKLGDLFTVTRLASLLPSVHSDALLHAAQHGQLAVAETLIELRADINSTDKSLRSPLSLAAQGGHLKLVQFLTSCLDSDQVAVDKNLSSPLIQAASNGHLEVVQLLSRVLIGLPHREHEDDVSKRQLTMHLPSFHPKPPLSQKGQADPMSAAAVRVSSPNATAGSRHDQALPHTKSPQTPAPQDRAGVDSLKSPFSLTSPFSVRYDTQVLRFLQGVIQQEQEQQANDSQAEPSREETSTSVQAQQQRADRSSSRGAFSSRSRKIVGEQQDRNPQDTTSDAQAVHKTQTHSERSRKHGQKSQKSSTDRGRPSEQWVPRWPESGCGASLSCRNADGDTALHVAARHGHVAVVQYLSELLVALYKQAQKQQGQHVCANRTVAPAKGAAAQEMQRAHSLSPTPQTRQPCKACSFRVSYPFPLDARGSGARSPAFHAAEHRHYHILQLLVAHGASVSVTDCNGLSLLSCERHGRLAVALQNGFQARVAQTAQNYLTALSRRAERLAADKQTLADEKSRLEAELKARDDLSTRAVPETRSHRRAIPQDEVSKPQQGRLYQEDNGEAGETGEIEAGEDGQEQAEEQGRQEDEEYLVHRQSEESKEHVEEEEEAHQQKEHVSYLDPVQLRKKQQRQDERARLLAKIKADQEQAAAERARRKQELLRRKLLREQMRKESREIQEWLRINEFSEQVRQALAPYTKLQVLMLSEQDAKDVAGPLEGRRLFLSLARVRAKVPPEHQASLQRGMVSIPPEQQASLQKAMVSPAPPTSSPAVKSTWAAERAGVGASSPSSALQEPSAAPARGLKAPLRKGDMLAGSEKAEAKQQQRPDPVVSSTGKGREFTYMYLQGGDSGNVTPRSRSAINIVDSLGLADLPLPARIPEPFITATSSLFSAVSATKQFVREEGMRLVEAFHEEDDEEDEPETEKNTAWKQRKKAQKPLRSAQPSGGNAQTATAVRAGYRHQLSAIPSADTSSKQSDRADARKIRAAIGNSEQVVLNSPPNGDVGLCTIAVSLEDDEDEDSPS